ncbi:MAG: hypothetical protein V3U92_09715 [Cellulophaga sp.]
MALASRNPFKELETSLLEVPPEMRKKVMSDIATAKLIMEMASLFTFNYSSVLEGLIKTGRG